MKPSDARDTAAKALECLEEIALEKGLDALSMRDVAARVGISLSSLQYHYPNKASLINAFIAQTMAEYGEGVSEILREDGPHQRFSLVAQYAIEESVQSAQGSLFTMIEARALHDTAAAEALRDCWRTYLGGFRDAIQHDYPQLSDHDALVAATLSASLIDGLTVSYKAALDLGLEAQTLTEYVRRSVIAIPERLARADGARTDQSQR